MPANVTIIGENSDGSLNAKLELTAGDSLVVTIDLSAYDHGIELAAAMAQAVVKNAINGTDVLLLDSEAAPPTITIDAGEETVTLEAGADTTADVTPGRAVWALRITDADGLVATALQGEAFVTQGILPDA